MDLESNIRSGDIYDKETIKICNQLGSHQMAFEKDESSSQQQRKTSWTSSEIETLNGI
jgi:predicted fused transcriptional regulator/phosphomethylpyrimidine kinase